MNDIVDFGAVLVGVEIVIRALSLNRRFAPLLALLLGVPSIVIAGGDYSPKAWLRAFFVAAAAVGAYSGVKNTRQVLKGDDQ
jgi:hypothetical protein